MNVCGSCSYVLIWFAILCKFALAVVNQEQIRKVCAGSGGGNMNVQCLEVCTDQTGHLWSGQSGDEYDERSDNL